ncbi:MAG: DNA adenine methylase [Lachnospiraceae bacterium]|nr:DNA adenine methylase [Lachnospiraceae bacterium]
MRSVLKYPGSKWNIADQLVSLIPEHHSYVEPFFGSGAVFFRKLPSAIEMINDRDSNVTNLFRCIQEDPERLAGLVLTTPFSREVYDNCYQEVSLVQMAMDDPYYKALLFLIKCWQGYGYRTSGHKVGWKRDVYGREKMYSLWDWYQLPDRIIKVAERLRMVQIENRPALDLIEQYNHSNVFMYLDPPYVFSTRCGKQYKYEMSNKDQENLLTTILKSKAKIMISGYESDLYNGYLQGWEKEYFTSCAEHGSSRQEVVWMNYQIGQINITDRDEQNALILR